MVPTLAQAQNFAQTLRSKFGNVPGMKARIDRAVDLVAAGDVYASQGDHYAVLSAKGDGTGYDLDAAGICNCPDAHHGAPYIRGASRCKHNLAYQIHARTLFAALNARILGSACYPNRRQQFASPNTFLLLIPGDGRTLLWADRVGHLGRVTWSNALSGHQPATVADRIAIEEWLDQAGEIPVVGQYMAELATAAAIDAKEAMARDAEIMPFATWRDLYRPLLAR